MIGMTMVTWGQQRSEAEPSAGGPEGRRRGGHGARLRGVLKWPPCGPYVLSDVASLSQLGRIDWRVVAALPDVPSEWFVAGDVALLVEAYAAEDGVELLPT
jgi:hypothetical protein